jgi:hypothetical protein
MGLNAWVYCDCYETGKAKAPPQPDLVYVDPESGSVSFRWEAEGADQHGFYDSRASACEHGPIGQLVSHRLGNILSIGYLRGRFDEAPEQFPTILAKVVYSGSHGGDVLTQADIEQVESELSAMPTLYRSDDCYQHLWHEFKRQMLELIQAAKSVSKPIVF